MELQAMTVEELKALDKQYKAQQDKFFGCGITGDFADRKFKEAQIARERIWAVLREKGAR